MKNKIVLSILASIVGLSQAQAQSNSATNTTKATAQLVSSCQIQAQNVNFGSLILPLTTQTATSNLSVLCNKGASYSIEMGYGGETGQSVPGTVYWYATTNSCGNGKYFMQGLNVVTYQNMGLICDIPANSTPANGGYYTGEPIGASYGKMTGAAKGDKVAYSIEVPGKPGTIWNNNNKYTAKGTGEFESIALKTTLIPAQSSGLYPIPDMYSDNVITKVTF